MQMPNTCRYKTRETETETGTPDLGPSARISGYVIGHTANRTGARLTAARYSWLCRRLRHISTSNHVE